MITQIHIKNFKSIVDLTLDLGRINLFIGENGSGKSNILEAVAFASSYANNRLLNSILSSKGSRITNPGLFYNAFSDSDKNEIQVDFIIYNCLIKTHLFYDNNDETWYETWHMIIAKEFEEFIKKYGEYIYYNPTDFMGQYLEKDILANHIKINPQTPGSIEKAIIDKEKELDSYWNHRYSKEFVDFMIYSPEVTYLRRFEEEGQVNPLGARGEGLFSLIKSMSKDNGSLQHIKEGLELIDWFEDFSIPNDLMSNEYRIAIKDRFINSDLKYLDQRSANEGFLFLLFYIVLFSSKRTPQFFAIDNIEASFNPKLCSKLIGMLVELAKKNNKQALMTTHNPATLDGLDLNDPEQRLFVVRRNIDGHTIVTRISEKPKISTPMKLSEMWLKGLLGGLPDNF